MAKKRKTRDQKILADSRHAVYHLETQVTKDSKPRVKKDPVDNELITSIPSITPSSPRSNVAALDYVKADIRKILLITAIIIALQIALFFLLQRI